MALSLTAVPAAFSSLHYDLIYTVADAAAIADPVTYPNFKFIGDVYVDGSLIARIKKVPDPTTGIGIFNISAVVRNYLATTFNPLINTLVAQELGDTNFNLSIIIHFGEEYGYVNYLDMLYSSAATYFNNYNGRLVGTTGSLIGFTDRVASNRPFIGKTFFSSQYNLISYFATNRVPVNVIVTPYGGGTVYTTTVTASVALNMLVLNVSPLTLNALQPGTIVPGTAFYTVQIGSLAYTFNVICEPMYQSYMIHFLNLYGGFDSRIFSKVSRRTFDITKTDFGKLPYTVGSDGSVSYKSNNGVYNETRSTYSVQMVEKLALNSDLLTDQEYTWLSDLVFSPMVYIEDSGYFFPCVITDTSYEQKKVVNDDLTNLTINIEYGTQLNAQYR